MVRLKHELRLHPKPIRKIEVKILKNINDEKCGNDGLYTLLNEDEYQFYLYTLVQKCYIECHNFGADGLEECTFPKITLNGQLYMLYYLKPWIYRIWVDADYKFLFPLIISIISVIIAATK